MTTAHIVKSTKFNPSKVRFSGKMLNKSRNTPTFYVNYEYDDGTVAPLRIQTPRLKSPFGISATLDGSSIDSPTVSSKDTLSLSLENEFSKFISGIEELDKMAFNVAFEYVREFLKIDEDDTDAVIESTAKKAYSKSVRYSIDKKTKKRTTFPPTFSGNVYKDTNGTYTSASFYDAEKAASDISKGIEPTPMVVTIHNQSDMYPRMSDASVVMKCSSLWTSNLGFGLLWVPEKVRVWKSSNKIEGFGFLADDEEDLITTSFENVTLEEPETEEEEEIDELDEIVNTPVPVQVKTSSRKKKL